MDHIEGVFAVGPHALVVAWNVETQSGRNSTANVSLGSLGSPLGSILLRLNVHEVHANNLKVHLSAVCPSGHKCIESAHLGMQVFTTKDWSASGRTAGCKAGLTLPCQWPRYLSHSPGRGCGECHGAAPERNAAGLSVRPGIVCGICPCGPFRAAVDAMLAVRILRAQPSGDAVLTSSHGYM